MKKYSHFSILFFVFFITGSVTLWAQKANDTNTPLHALQPDYKVPYGTATPESVKKVMDRILVYLDNTTPPELINSKTSAVITDLKKPHQDAVIRPGDFRLNSYEWGVVYGAMLLAGTETGDKRYTEYTAKRFKFIAEVVPYFREFAKAYPDARNPLRQTLDPRALDDAGAMCTAMIKAERAGVVAGTQVRPLIDNFIQFITKKEHRLADGTLARNRPLPNTLWLDDLYMGVPAIAQMGKLTGERQYYDEAVKQIMQFSGRMFNKEKRLYMHGWNEGMDVHPQFHWGRANGWALLAMSELLDVLPESHAGRNAVLQQFKDLVKGLATYQSGSGFWHQLLDRNDSYLETSATAIYAYCIAHACNKGWIDAMIYGPMSILAWNAVSTKINDKGQVEGTCVGTGMAFDPAFYYYRPVNVFAAHGYGPAILAGAEIIELLNNYAFYINDSSLQLKEKIK
jgi:rhamnogalacturonyl hydrolase YesR